MQSVLKKSVITLVQKKKSFLISPARYSAKQQRLCFRAFCLAIKSFLLFEKFEEESKSRTTLEDHKTDAKETTKMASTVTSQYPTFNQPIFSDEELSEIFQIDFAEIFGSPDKPSKYSSPQRKTVTTVAKGRTKSLAEYK